MNTKNITGSQIRFYRRQRGWTQHKLAEILMAAGVPITRSIIANIETQRCAVTDIEIVSIAGALQIPVVRFFTGDLPADCTGALKIKPVAKSPPPSRRLVKLARWLSGPARKLFGNRQGRQ